MIFELAESTVRMILSPQPRLAALIEINNSTVCGLVMKHSGNTAYAHNVLKLNPEIRFRNLMLMERVADGDVQTCGILKPGSLPVDWT